MDIAGLLVDAFGRTRAEVHSIVEGLDAAQLAFRPDRDANSIAWLVWHLARIEDDHVADAAGLEQVWTAQHWVDRFALPFAASATGYVQDSDDVAAVRGLVARGDRPTGSVS